MKRKKYILVAIVTLLINYSLDQLTKYIAVIYLKDSDPIYLLYKTVLITYAENTGAFLSMGSDWPISLKYIVLAILPILFCLYGIYYCVFKENDMTRLVLIASVIAGGLGNLIDRLFNDFAVVDFLNFGIGSLRTGILNVADLSVTFGAILFLIYESKFFKNKRINNITIEKSDDDARKYSNEK